MFLVSVGFFNSISTKNLKFVKKRSNHNKKGRRQKTEISIFSLLKEKKTKGNPIAKIKRNSILAPLPK